VETDWSVECAADDPTVAVPWASADKSIFYIDLRDSPDRVNEIPEAVRHTCLAAALLRWNERDASLFTAKCDAWNYRSDMFDANDLEGFDYARGSYIDLLAKNPAIFSSFDASERMLKAGNNAARSISFPAGRTEWILRPAHIFAADVDGFAITLYVWGYGASPEEAASAWSTALLALIEPVLLIGEVDSGYRE
jgi:hypothetical protein